MPGNPISPNALLDLEEIEEEDWEVFRARYQALTRLAREGVRRGDRDTDTPEA